MTQQEIPNKTEQEIIAKALQNNTPKQQEIQDRTDALLKLLFQGRKNFTKIAEIIGVSRNQAYEYWRRWKQSEEADQVDWEWWTLYRRLKRVNPTKALECLTRIKYRMTTEKTELKADIREIHLEWIQRSKEEPKV